MLRKVYNDYFKHAAHLKISGNISHETADYVIQAVNKLKFRNPQAITLTIDSADGSLVSSEIIVQCLKSKSSELKIPFYTFVQSYALGPAFVILTSGNKSFANPHSIVGGLSSNISSVGLVKTLEKFKVKCTPISTAPIRIDPFQKLSPQDEQWVQGQINHKQQLLAEFLERQNNGKTVLEKVKNGEIFTGSQAVREGIVGSLENFESLTNREFKDLKEVNYSQKKRKNWGRAWSMMEERINVETIEEIFGEDESEVQFLSELASK